MNFFNSLPQLISKLMLSIIGFSQSTLAQDIVNLPDEFPVYQYEVTDEELLRRIKAMPVQVVAPRFNPVVKSYIHTYTVKKRAHTKTILERAAIYFPLIERQLEEKELPLELRCLPILESALNPNAVSKSNAVGLWQFMPGTAKDCGLRMNSQVDERKDIHQSTHAALGYLRYLFNRFGNWELALAAYNSGPSTVAKAISKAQSNDFWRIRDYLPKETQNYVPAFIAALYIWNYFDLHGISPDYPPAELQITSVVPVYSRLSFYEISEITGIPYSTVKFLNPAFKNGVIPASTEGHNLTIPHLATEKILAYLHYQNPIDPSTDYSGNPAKEYYPDKVSTNKPAIYRVRKEDDLLSLAQQFNCSTQQLCEWNNLKELTIHPGQKLQIYFHPSVTINSKLLMLPTINYLMPMLKIDDEHILPLPISLIPEEKNKFYYVRPGDTFRDVLRKHPGLFWEELLQLNPDLKNNPDIRIGTKLRIK